MSYTPITDGTRATPDAFNSRFEELLHSGISVVNLQHPEFGAKLDGIANDTYAIQRAVEKAGENGVIYIPRGKKARIVETILLKQGQTVTGGGTVIFDPGVTVASGPFSNEGCTTTGGYDAAGNITITDITIESPNGNGLLFAHADGIRILGVRATKWYHHIVDLIGCKNVVVGDCFGVNGITGNPDGSGIQIDQAQVGSGAGTVFIGGVETSVYLDNTACRDVVIRHNEIESNTQSFGLHVHRNGHSNVLFHGNIVRGCLRGFHSDPGVTHEGIAIVDNHFENCNSYGIACESTFHGLRISGNKIHNVSVAYGIWVRSTNGATRDLSIVNNEITDFAFSGIRVEGADNFVINDNVVYNATGATKRGIVVVDMGAGTITGNTVDCAVEMGGGSDTPGIYVVRDDGGTNRDITIADNHVRRVYRGIWVTNDSENVNVTGNTIAVVSDRGILLGNGNLNYDFVGCVVSNNAVRSFNRSGVVVENPTHCVVEGNVVRECIGSGVDGRGVQLAGTGAYNVVEGNVAHGGNRPTNSSGILISTEYTSVRNNIVTGWATGLNQTASGLTGTTYFGNVARDNNSDSNIDAGMGSGEQPFGLNWLGDQTNPMFLPPIQINDSSGGCVLSGLGDPEGNVSAPMTSIYIRTNIPGFLQAIYVKVSNIVPNEGWRAIAYLDANGNLATPGDAWNVGHFVLGAYHLWVDGSGRLRIKNGAPSSDTDGTVVGTQS